MSKKSFKDNPALQFVSKGESARSAEVREIRKTEEFGSDSKKKTKIPIIRDTEDYGRDLRYVPKVFEAKSKRFNMLIRPSVFAHLKKDAKIKGTSVNDLMHTIFEAYIENSN